MDKANEGELVSVKPAEPKVYRISCMALYHAWDSCIYEVEASGPNEALRIFKDYDDQGEMIDSSTDHWEHIEDFRDEVTIDDVEER